VTNEIAMKIVEISSEIACQNGSPLRRVENGRYDFQIITFQDLKNATSIAVIDASAVL
jgi:hypothetical protein